MQKMNSSSAVLLTLSLTCIHLVLVDNMSSTVQDGFKGEQSDTSEPDVFSIILKANEELLNRTGNKIIQYGDILVGTTRNAKICDNEPRSCLWPASNDGNVYVPYIIHEDYNNYRISVSGSSHEGSYYNNFAFVPCILLIFSWRK